MPHPYDKITATVLQDSISPDDNGGRITTMILTMPRFILAEFNTHRCFSRNSASSRAIPLKRQISNMNDGDYYIPIIGKNQKGMSSDGEPADAETQGTFNNAQEKLRKEAQATALQFEDYHKQWVSRILEPWGIHTVLVTSMDWENFFELRCHKAAQPEMQVLAIRMFEALWESVAVARYIHAPFYDDESLEFNPTVRGLITMDTDLHIVGIDPELENILKMSAGRCARVSYKQHDGVIDPVADIGLAEKLASYKHLSPFEHQAIYGYRTYHKSNFHSGWIQYRSLIPGAKETMGMDEIGLSIVEQFGENPTVMGYEVVKWD